MPLANVGSATLWKVLLLALLLRLAMPLAAWLLSGGRPLVREPDSTSYLECAQSLWRERAFAREGLPEIVRTPGYPMLLVPGVALGRVDLWAILLQACCGTLTVYLVMRLTAETAFDAGGLDLPASTAQQGRLQNTMCVAAGVVAACDPLAVLYCGKLLSETCFTTALAVCLLGLIRHAATSRVAPLVWAALALAAATFIRPISYYLPPLVAVWLVCATSSRASRANAALGAGRLGTTFLRRCLHGALFLLLAMGPSLLWQARNYLVAGYVGFSAITDINLYYWQAASVVAAREQIPFLTAQDRLLERQRAAPLQRAPGQSTRADRFLWLRREGLQILRQHPWLYARIHAKGMLAVIIDAGTQAWLDYVRYEPPPRPAESAGLRRLMWAVKTKPGATLVHVLLRAWLGLLLVFGALGLYHMPRSGAWWLLGLVFLYLWCLSGGELGYHRFRIPLLAIVSVWAGRGAVWGWKWCRGEA